MSAHDEQHAESVGAERERLFGRLSLLRSKVSPECQALLVSRELVDGLLAWSGRLADAGVQLDPRASPETGWQDISTAPVIEFHGEPIDALVFGSVGMFMGRVARYKDGHLFAGVAHVAGNLAGDGITHWKPRPEVPHA